MSSALAMVLMVAMAVPGNGPEKVSGEVEQERLDLRGEWRGELRSKSHGVPPMSHEVELAGGRVRLRAHGKTISDAPCQITDEGSGRLRIKVRHLESLGIYRWDGDRLTISYKLNDLGWPNSFRVDEDQSLLILHRVKPGK